jgi:putative membrane protein
VTASDPSPDGHDHQTDHNETDDDQTDRDGTDRDGTDDGDRGDLEWHRPHPFTVVAEIGRSIRAFIVAVLAVRGDFLGGGLITEAVLVGLPLVAALGRWLTTRYAVDVEALHHHYGLLWRKRQVLPRANIQNVSTKAGVVARLGSVVELDVSDASANGDISIRYVTAEEADRLTALLRNPASLDGNGALPGVAPPPLLARASEIRSGDGPDGGQLEAAGSPHGLADGPTDGPRGQPVERPALVETALPLLARVEATTLGVLSTVLLALAAPVVVLIAIGMARSAGSAPALPTWLYAAGALAVPVLGAVAQVVSRLLMLGNFSLTAEPDRLRIRVGLLTEVRVTARRERIQQIRVVRQLPHRLQGLERVEYETADVELIDATAVTGYLNPVGPTDGWIPLAEEVFSKVDPVEGDLQQVSPLTRRRMLVRIAVAVLAAAAAAAVVAPVAAMVIIVAGIGLGRWYSRARYEVLGWAMTEDQVLIRQGVLNQTLTLVRISKVQALHLRSTFFQRRLGLVTLQLSTAGRGVHGLVTLPDLTGRTASALLDQLAHRSAATPIADTL